MLTIPDHYIDGPKAITFMVRPTAQELSATGAATAIAEEKEGEGGRVHSNFADENGSMGAKKRSGHTAKSSSMILSPNDVDDCVDAMSRVNRFDTASPSSMTSVPRKRFGVDRSPFARDAVAEERVAEERRRETSGRAKSPVSPGSSVMSSDEEKRQASWQDGAGGEVVGGVVGGAAAEGGGGEHLSSRRSSSKELHV